MSDTPPPLPDWLIEASRVCERFMVAGNSPLGLIAMAWLAGWEAATARIETEVKP